MRLALCFAFALAVLCPAPDATAQNKAAAIERLARRYVELGRLNGTLLVAEQGKVLFSHGYGYAEMEWKVPNGSDTRFRIASVTKPFTALLIMQLVEEGKLSLDTTLSALLPFYRKDTGSRITLRHLLSHSAGIPNFVQLPGFLTSTMREPVDGTTQFILRYCSGDLEFEPGSAFAYSNSGYFILGAIIEAVTGKPYAEVLQSKIFLPAGMTASGVDKTGLLLPKRASGYQRLFDGTYIPAPYWDPGWAYAAGAMYSTVDDLLKFYQALAAGKLLSPAGIATMTTPIHPAFGQWYGLGWMLARMPLAGRGDTLTLIQHRGDVYGTTAFFSHAVHKDQTVILLCNVGGDPVQDIVNGIFNLLNDVAPELPKKSIAEELYRVLNMKGIDAAAARYRAACKTEASGFSFAETELNMLGYELLRSGHIPEAVRMFELNVEAYPDAFNTYDSLGDACVAAGDKARAIVNYRKAVALNPNHMSGRKKLADLGAPVQESPQPE